MSVVQILDEVVEVIEERVVMLLVLGHEIPELALDGPQCLQAFSLGHVQLSRCCPSRDSTSVAPCVCVWA